MRKFIKFCDEKLLRGNYLSAGARKLISPFSRISLSAIETSDTAAAAFSENIFVIYS